MSQTQTLSDKKVEKYSKKHIYAVRENGGKGLPVDLVYDPETFWGDLGEEYYKAFTSQAQLQANTVWLIDRLKSLNVSTLLDVGCGFGRMLPFLLEAGAIKSANGIDISDGILKSSETYLNPTPTENITLDDYIKKLHEAKLDSMLRLKLEELLTAQYAKRKQNPPDFRDKIRLKKGDARKIDADSDSFDCVMSSETLQHLCPQDAEDAMLHMVRVASRAVVLIERFAFAGEHSQPDVWSHDYPSMFKKLGIEVAQAMVISNGLNGYIALKR